MKFHSHSPRRQAILIASPGEGLSFLRGVKADISYFRYFLESDQGGKWYDEEIKILFNPSITEVISNLVDNDFDYHLTYFSGHGCIYDNVQILSLRDGTLEERDLIIPNCPRQRIIIDACRNYIEPLERPLDGKEIGDIWERFTGSPTRDIMDDLIIRSPHGVEIAYASGPGVSATETPQGGYFTSELLKRAFKLESADRKIHPATLDYLIDEIPPLEIDRKRRIFQIPEILILTGYLKVPFAFTNIR